MDYYQILGVSHEASQEDIKKAFHKLAHKHHPHKGGDEKKFKEINEAYQVLSNKEKRAQYDKFGQVFGSASGGTDPGFGSNWAWGNPAGGSATGGIDFEFGDLDDIFDGFPFGFGSKRQRTKDLKRGKNIRIDIEFSLEDILKDINKEINLRKNVVCPRCEGTGAEPETKINECFSCRGTGQVRKVRKMGPISFTEQALCPECQGEGQKPEKPCNVCKGEGRIRGDEDIKIFIPAGVDSNQVIEISGKGDAGKKGGIPGNLYVRIFVKPHSIFERKGDDLYTYAPVSFSQAALGSEIDIKILKGKTISLKVPAGTESGKVIKISGKGIPYFSSYGRGNLYIGFIVETPKKLTREQKDLLKKLKQTGL